VSTKLKTVINLKKDKVKHLGWFVLASLTFAILLGIAYATVEVWPESWTISPYDTQTIHIKNVYEGPIYTLYQINVTRPDGTVDTYNAPPGTQLGPGEELTVDYPDDFPTGSTADAGTYHVLVHGQTTEPYDINTEWDVTKFNVVPEFVLSSMAMLSLVFAGYLLYKRRT